jgi:hypothetical protein
MSNLETTFASPPAGQPGAQVTGCFFKAEIGGGGPGIRISAGPWPQGAWYPPATSYQFVLEFYGQVSGNVYPIWSSPVSQPPAAGGVYVDHTVDLEDAAGGGWGYNFFVALWRNYIGGPFVIQNPLLGEGTFTPPAGWRGCTATRSVDNDNPPATVVTFDTTDNSIGLPALLLPAAADRCYHTPTISF